MISGAARYIGHVTTVALTMSTLSLELPSASHYPERPLGGKDSEPSDFMSTASVQPQTRDPDELVLGIVAPLGTDLRATATSLEEGLRLVGYTTHALRLSELLRPPLETGIDLQEESEGARLRSYMAAGTAARSLTKRGDFLALAASARISEARPNDGEPMPRTAHLLLTLKHPEEVRTLREIYGPGFYLIGVSSSQGDRIRHLIEYRGIPQTEAEDLIRLDTEELQANQQPDDFGQKTRDTFELADVFIRAGDKAQIARFLDLIFGDPFQTPTQEEHAMFMAYASSLRSADLSRQVGAVILSKNGDVIATGTNDVAAPGGGLYWSGEGDARDFARGKDINEQRRNEFVIDVMRRISPDSEETDDGLLQRGKKLLEGSPIFDITEFGRAVHAEMEALLVCARSGVSPVGGTLVCTTFPCHNCAKHIVAAGIARVVYVEPYPKSQAHELFRESIVVEDLVESRDLHRDQRVPFSPFSGIGPRRYIDLFSLGLGSGYKQRRKKKGAGGAKFEWKREAGRARVPMRPTSYLEREKVASDLLKRSTTYLHDELEKWKEEQHERRE